MRVIKFKAWDVERKKMFSSKEMGKDQLTLSPDGRGFINVSGISTKLSTYLPHLIPLQFLDLKNEKGVDVDWWEGDLFELFSECPLYKIIYRDGCYYFKSIMDSHSIPVRDVLAWVKLPTKIGNIHENPELLGKSANTNL